MYYTREPIVETVVTPKEGCKLVLRNSKQGHRQEDFLVDAVEVVSFGSSLFFRSQERPKPFLLPVSDYEIIELKETKMVLKAVSHDRSIKIAGGREPAKQTKAPKEKDESSSKKTVKRRHRRKKMETDETKLEAKGGDKKDETPVSSSTGRGLLPPPSMLIKEKLKKIKDESVSTEAFKEESKPVEEKPNPKAEVKPQKAESKAETKPQEKESTETGK